MISTYDIGLTVHDIVLDSFEPIEVFHPFIFNQFALSDIIAIIAEVEFPVRFINTLTNNGFQYFPRL